MRYLLLILVAFTLTGADLQPGEQLPWCRVTLNMASTIDTDPPIYRTIDGWYDATTHTAITAEMVQPGNAGAAAPMDPARIVRVEPAAGSQTPPRAIVLANAIRRIQAASDQTLQKQKQADAERAKGKSGANDHPGKPTAGR